MAAQTLSSENQQTVNEFIQKAGQAKVAGNKNEEAGFYNKIGNIYWENNISNEAIDYFNKSLVLNKEIGNSNAVSIIYSYLGSIYTDANQDQKALEVYQLGYDLAKKMKNKKSMADFLNNMGTCLNNMERLEDANDKFFAASKICQEINDATQLRTLYFSLYQNFNKQGNTDDAMKYFDLYRHYDTESKKIEVEEIRNKSKEETDRERGEKFAKQHELEQNKGLLKEIEDSLKLTLKQAGEKELRIELLNQEMSNQYLQLREQKARLQAERTVIYALLIGMVLTAAFSFFIFRLFREKQRMNNILQQQNEEIQAQKDEIEEQSRRLNLSNKEIHASIYYAQRIQLAILPLQKDINKLFDSFTIFRPKDIVSGDFYWLAHFQETLAEPEKIFIATVDCTGHGVPGAFMALIGNRLLNEIVKEKKIFETHHILNSLYWGIVEFLRQEETDNTDGMEICLCRLERQKDKTIKVMYSGAKLPLFVFRHDKNDIEIIKPDRVSIGGIKGQNGKPVSFTSKQLVLNDLDCMYMFTDGILDQNNPERERFGTNRLIETLKTTGSAGMVDQKKNFEEKFDSFRNNSDQRDDILLIGLNMALVQPTDKRFTIKWTGKTILIAEDQDLNFLVINDYLRHAEINLIRAINGKEAIDFLKSNPIDLVLMDLQMPTLDGISAIKQIRQFNEEIPIIVQTAFNTSNEKEKSFKAGCTDYIAKPIQLNELITLLDKYLSQKN
jgi:CheY-like chemotaxis protein